jgi:hypothetical protein
MKTLCVLLTLVPSAILQEEYDQMIQNDESDNGNYVEEVKAPPVASKLGWIQGVLVSFAVATSRGYVMACRRIIIVK